MDIKRFEKVDYSKEDQRLNVDVAMRVTQNPTYVQMEENVLTVLQVIHVTVLLLDMKERNARHVSLG